MAGVNDVTDAYLKEIYYNPSHPGSYSGAVKLHRVAQAEGHAEISLKTIKSWLSSQDTHTLHRSVRRKFKRVVVTGIAAQYDSDFTDMTNLARFNDGVKYFMATIDVFSRYLWVVPMKGKTSSDALTALKELFRIAPIPRLFRTDIKGRGVHR